MSDEPPAPEGSARLVVDSRCPALGPSSKWDEPAMLRGEILLADQLVEHAAELSLAHGEPSHAVRTDRLWQRFLSVRRQIHQAYGVLTARLRDGQDPSPAEEWLLENSHVVEDQIREIREDLPRGYRAELPRLATGAMRGHPRVYGLCLDYLRHTDARLDLTTLGQYVESYQRGHSLTIGELWAVPIMLRLGLLLTVGALAASEAKSGNRERADAWAERVLGARQSEGEIQAVLREIERDRPPISPPFLVQLARRLRESDDASLGVVFDWLAARSHELGASPEELARIQHLKQAADQVSVGNAITSMRTVGALDWNAFFEQTSVVEALLRQDPFGTYAATDKVTRDRYRHAVERLARRASGGEFGIARSALSLASASHERAPDDVKRAHVGYYLVDAGHRELERSVGYRPRLRERFRNAVLDHPEVAYFGPLGALTAAGVGLVVGAGAGLLPRQGEPWQWLVAGLLALLPASEVALALTQAFVTALLHPRLLPRLDFDAGIPSDCRTLVAVPCLLDSRATLALLLEDLEVRSLANEGKHLHFALLTDFRDADAETEANDEGLLEAAREGIALLNERYRDVPHRYWLLHRRRLHNPNEGRFMGWERKRGKLEELNRLLRGRKDTSYTVVDAPTELFASIRYVITLDVDTELPRETARALVATIAHPLNRAELDRRRQRVVHGYGVVQPRVGALPLSARRSRYAMLASGPSGVDPYTTAVSDVYQDLFGEGSYTGKAIYDVDAFAGALAGRSPENILLSHDLFESFFARSALASDIELFDEQPAAYAVHAGRQHRWMRGDWQLLRWLFPSVPGRTGRRPNDLRVLDRWKLLDNLRRSCLPPALVLGLLAGWWAGGVFAALASGLVVLVLLLPALVQAVLALSGDSNGRFWTPFSGLGGNLVRGALGALLEAVFMLDQALLSLDAIGIAFYRTWRKRKTLEWTTMRQSAAGWAGGVSLRMLLGSALAGGFALALGLLVPASLPVALPFLAGWLVAPLVAKLLSQPFTEPRQADLLAKEDRHFLRLLSRKTWRFFHHFVTADENHLPPDNYQEEPRGVVAHRTSPTNIGLYLLSTLSAHDFGFVTQSELVARLRSTLDTLDRLPRRDGHLLNWYDTETLAPLPPEYVSTVDSGNLAAYLWTLASAGPELRRSPVVGDEAYRGIADALELSCDAMGMGVVSMRAAPLRALARELRAISGGRSLAQEAARLSRIRDAIARELPSARDLPVEARYWLVEAERSALAWLEQLRLLAPFIALVEAGPPSGGQDPAAPWERLRAVLATPTTLEELHAALQEAQELVDELDETSAPTAPSSASAHFVAELAEALEQGRHRVAELLEAVDRTSDRCRALADGMSFRFLFDEKRELFSTGYNVSNGRLDASHYDLLASEARLASLVAIAKGDAPQKHWFRLGRPRARVDAGRALLSWSGSMFEYLMPLLVTESRPETLLAETAGAAVRQQRAYAAKQHVVWGISESAYNVMDLELTYQYRAFGVPGLGLKVGLAEDLVVTPYATALAALVDPVAAVKNLRALSREGLAGQFGYFEAIDYSASRLPPGKRGVVVKSFMAHHLGMTLVALGNVIHDRRMQRRFHADPRIKASELLLEERIPTGAPLFEVPDAALAAPTRQAPDLDPSERVRLDDGGPLRAHLLGHGALSTLVTSGGCGALTWKGMDVNRFRQDAVFDAGGIYAYVRNLTSHRVWSASYYPSRRTPDAYDASFFIDHVEIRRRDGALETITEIVPSAEHAAEVRRFTLTNHGAEPCELELTTFTELALAPHATDLAHRAFSTLFVETEALPEQGAVLAHRRPQSPAEAPIWVAQVLTPEDEAFGPLDHDTSRQHFVGRTGSLERPRALDKPEARLAGRTGAVLDPAFVLRRRALLQPGASARVTLTTVMADSREELLHLIAIYAAPQAIPRAFELGLADARVELRHLGVTAVQAHRFQRLLSAVLFPQPGLRAKVDASALSGGENSLWARGISGSLPIVVLRVDHPDFDQLFRELLLAHEYFRINGVALDLVVLNDEPSIYLQPMQEHALDVVRSVHAEGRMDQPGGIFLRRSDQMSEADQRLLLSAARAVFSAASGSLSRQLKRAARRGALPEPLTFAGRSLPRRSTPPPAVPELLFDNGTGGFTPDGREYRMTLDRERRTPLAWCNVLANPSFGTLVTERGSCFTWSRNNQRHRLTPWSNDPLLDPSGEVVYVRDDEDGSVWSATPGPSGGSASYQVAHGQGYTRFVHARGGLSHELSVFVSARDPVRFQRLRIENRGEQPRRLSVFGVVEWVLGQHREKGALSVHTEWDAESHAIVATSPFAIAPHATAFYSTTAPVRSFSADRAEFFGTPGSRRLPHALRRVRLSGQCGSGLDPCAALETSVTLGPGESFVVTFVLGEAAGGREQARALALSYAHDTSVVRALEEVREHWEKVLTTVSVTTPDPALDVLMNRWVPYQALACRLWARGAFYQSSGAYGFRDQLQDSLALLHALPNVAREQILRSAARQFVEGDVQHWWHPEAGDGVRTRCSDDKLWLPYAVAEYLRVTDDRSVLEEPVPFLEERPLLPEEHDLYSTPNGTSEAASLYEHCARALDAALVVGPHGLPRIGAGDWNDGMNRVGVEQRGESVWLAWFLVKALRDFAPLAHARRDAARATRWLEQARRLTDAVEAHGWDGAWYRRAYFDDGSPVGSASSPECRIDAIAQSWAVIAGTGDSRRAAAAVLASDRLLVDESAGLMALLAPPFTGAGPDPGYIASYPAGIRENGGQYTHGALFALRALAMLGDSERVERLLGLLNPIRHALTPEAVARYQVEPYVVAADVYSSPEHLGRGGWTWYTGSAGWFYRVVLEDVLGFRRQGNRVTLSPCLPASWPRAELVYRYGRSRLRILVENARGAASGDDALMVDGRPRVDRVVELVDDGRSHEVRLRVGARRLLSSA